MLTSGGSEAPPSWAEARWAIEAELARGETPELLEALGWAAWWLSDEALTIAARERAYRLYRARADAVAAGRVATWVASDHRELRGDEAIGRGWLARAHRLLDGLPACAEHGWLAMHEGAFLIGGGGDPAEIARLGRSAASLGRRLGVADLEAVGLATEGAAEVTRGYAGRGVRRLDEAAAIACGEELALPISAGWALCCVIAAFDLLGDLPRALQWGDAMRAHAEYWGSRQLLGECRSSYGSVLTTAGEWERAEAELTAAVDDLLATRPGQVAPALARLGVLRARQGRADEARELFERAGPYGLLGLGRLALARGEAACAADAAERVLRRLPDTLVLGRLPALELLALARGGEALDDLDAAAARLGTPYVAGRACAVRAEVALARGDHDAARRAAEDAIDRLTEAGARPDAAAARLLRARALEALGRPAAAAAERRSAGPGDPRVLSELSARELEVLGLVARGHSDAQIAGSLFLSPHTVHRHVANIRAKLRLPSRAAAVAYATRSGLL